MSTNERGYKYELVYMGRESLRPVSELRPVVWETNDVAAAVAMAVREQGVIWDHAQGILYAGSISGEMGPQEMALVAWCYRRYVAEGK